MKICIFFLKIKIFYRVFEPSDKPITIGRIGDNTIIIDDNLLSKNQCKIEYKSGKNQKNKKKLKFFKNNKKKLKKKKKLKIKKKLRGMGFN